MTVFDLQNCWIEWMEAVKKVGAMCELALEESAYVSISDKQIW